MITKVSENLISTHQSNATELIQIQAKYPNVSVIINNFTYNEVFDEDDELYLVNLNLDYLLYVETTLQFETQKTKICFAFYYIIDGIYYLITKIALFKVFTLDQDSKVTLQKAIIAYSMCQKCYYNTSNHLLACAVNPTFIFDQNNQCKEFELE